MERREVLCPVMFWKSSEKDSQRDEERSREGAEDQPPRGWGEGGLALNLQNGQEKPASEFALSENWSLDFKVWLVLTGRTPFCSRSEMLRGLDSVLFAGEEICFTGFNLVFRAYVCVFSLHSVFSALSCLFSESGTGICLSQRK